MTDLLEKIKSFLGIGQSLDFSSMSAEEIAAAFESFRNEARIVMIGLFAVAIVLLIVVIAQAVMLRRLDDDEEEEYEEEDEDEEDEEEERGIFGIRRRKKDEIEEEEDEPEEPPRRESPRVRKAAAAAAATEEMMGNPKKKEPVPFTRATSEVTYPEEHRRVRERKAATGQIPRIDEEQLAPEEEPKATAVLKSRREEPVPMKPRRKSAVQRVSELVKENQEEDDDLTFIDLD